MADHLQLMTNGTHPSLTTSKAPTFFILQPPSSSNVPPQLPQLPQHPHHQVQAAAAAAQVVRHAPTTTGKKRKRNSDNGEGHPGKRVKVTNPGPRDEKRMPLPSTTTIESASTDSEERAIRNAYVTIDGKHVCGECGNCLATSWGLDAHIKSVHGRKGFKCDFCDKSFGRKDHLVNHTKSMHTGTKECSQCGVVCSGKDGLTKHITENHPIIPTMFHQCSDCGRNYPTESACKIHIQQEHTRVNCQECGATCNGTEGLKKHVVKEHTKTGAGKSATTSSGFQIEVVFKCEYCSGTFSQQSSLDEHIRSFHIELQCGACGSNLIGTQAVLEHVQESHQASKVMFNTGETCHHCEICDSTFDKGQLYDNHFIENHVFGKVGNQLVRASALLSDSVSPSNVKPLVTTSPRQEQALNIVYQCAHCDALFTEQDQLTKHMDSTHPETFALPTEPLPQSVLAEFQKKPPSSSSVGIELERRVNKIEEQVYFQCLICEQLFVEASLLHAHMAEAHDSNKNSRPKTNGESMNGGLNVLYECQHCKGLFADRVSLEAHVATDHQSKIKGEDKILTSSSENLGDESGLVAPTLFGQSETL